RPLCAGAFSGQPSAWRNSQHLDRPYGGGLRASKRLRGPRWNLRFTTTQLAKTPVEHPRQDAGPGPQPPLEADVIRRCDGAAAERHLDVRRSRTHIDEPQAAAAGGRHAVMVKVEVGPRLMRAVIIEPQVAKERGVMAEERHREPDDGLVDSG